MNRPGARLLLNCLVLLTLLPAYGWNRPTHMATGALAYRELQITSPRTVDRIVAILRQHPNYQQRWAGKLNDSSLSADDRNQYLFMLAARWPDDVRGKDNPYDHPGWHYINYVYAPEQRIYRTDTLLATGEDILYAFERNRQLLRGNAPDSAKAIALCWLFHLAGDIHQPLHTTALVDSQFTQGDRGGNLFLIKAMPSSPVTNLHSFWDGMLLSDDDYASVNTLAVQLRHEFARSQLYQSGNPNMVAWSKESFQLAQDNAYRSHTLLAGTSETGTVLPIDYVATVRPIAERQVALAGYRLADELTAVFASKLRKGKKPRN